MINQNFKELYDKFREVMINGDEQEARNFLVSHLKEFPQEIQDEIVLAFFQEGLEKAAEEAQLLRDFQVQALEEVKEIEQIRGEVKDKLDLLKIKEEISRLKEDA